MSSPPFQGPYHASNQLLHTLSRVEAAVAHIVARERRYIREFQRETYMVEVLEKTPKELINDVLKELVAVARAEKREADAMRVVESGGVVVETTRLVKRVRVRVSLE